jgi:serine/threonine-protein kinase
MSAARLSENVLGSSRFEPLRILGEGGSGIVYEVRDRAGQTFALKVLRAELAPSEKERRRFLAEAARMQRLDADGLVPLRESGLLPDGRPYLAMPLLDGETLAERLRRGPLPPLVAARYFAMLASAVHALHEAGMVHRDVKPENVMLVDDSPVLLDFGIARDIDDGATTTTVEGRVRGTPAYMAPERFFGAPASVRSDVYELGVVLYMMLVGRLPWGSEKNVTDRLNPANPRDVGADVSRGLATVILRALSTRPEVRPATALELAEEVAAAAGESKDASRRTLDIEVQAPPEGLAPRATEARPRRAVSQAPAALPRSKRGIWLVAFTCVVAVAAGLGARLVGRSAAPAAAALTTPAPTSCAAMGMASIAPAVIAELATPAAAAPSAAQGAERAADAPKPRPAPSGAVRAGGPVPVRPAGSPAPAVTPVPTSPAIDPSKFYEDRR